ncbi:MAG TPA: hypothetical protein VFV51_06025 [Vicinamibacterales bacterium]|nr:hypothetical protein [Vicinamibacterales bacterium]
MRRVAGLILWLQVVLAPAAAAQDAAHQHDTGSSAWQWGVDGNAFFGYNYQYRKFTDFDEWESQNWLMTTLSRSFGSASQLRLDAMFSFEPFTLRDIGSPQVFQTGETYQGAPLIDYQHPHDLIMNLGAEYSRSVGAATMVVQGYLVGPAPIGPPVFMHRPSAAENPQAPLSHHNLDATHITPGVITVGLEHAGFTFEAGAFHGREPDEDRLDLDTAALDSYGARLSWADGAWDLQISAADLETPETNSPYDASRITASVSYFKGDSNRSIAWMAAFGQNREVFGNLEAYLLEGTRRFSKNALYMRAETVEKDILDAGFHPSGINHAHRPSLVSALTIGYVRDVVSKAWGTFGLGADATGYIVPDNLKESYGSPASFHFFVRYRGRAGAVHIH